AAGFAPDLEPALNAGEASEALRDREERDLELEPDPDRGQRVRHVVAPGHVEATLAERLAVVHDLEAARHTGERDLPRDELRVRVDAVRHDPLRNAGDPVLDVRLV